MDGSWCLAAVDNAVIHPSKRGSEILAETADVFPRRFHQTMPGARSRLDTGSGKQIALGRRTHLRRDHFRAYPPPKYRAVL
ncbi:hypothetical protein D3C81_1240950 [compost metagenome]